MFFFICPHPSRTPTRKLLLVMFCTSFEGGVIFAVFHMHPTSKTRSSRLLDVCRIFVNICCIRRVRVDVRWWLPCIFSFALHPLSAVRWFYCIYLSIRWGVMFIIFACPSSATWWASSWSRTHWVIYRTFYCYAFIYVEKDVSLLPLSCIRRERGKFIVNYLHLLSETVSVSLSIYLCISLRRPSDDVRVHRLSEGTYALIFNLHLLYSVGRFCHM